ncbi:MAG: hypothetical protein AB1374_12030 [Bacillota bacterium]
MSGTTGIENLLARIQKANPLKVSQLLDELLNNVQEYEKFESEFGGDQRKRSLNRSAALSEICNLFSTVAYEEALGCIDQDNAVNCSILEKNSTAALKPAAFKPAPFKPACRIKEPFCYDRYTHRFVDRWYAEQRYAIGTYGSVVVQLPSVEHQRRSARKEQAGGAKEDSGAGPGRGEERPLLQEEKSCEPQGKQGGGPNRFHGLIGWLFAQGALFDGIFFLLLCSTWRWPIPWFWSFYPLVMVLNAGCWVYLIASRGAHVLKAVVPRLAATAIVGLVPPLITKDIWEFSFVLWEQRFLYWIAVAGLLLATWVYLFIETQNRVGKGGLSARRAFHILLRLGNFALFFSWWATTFAYTVEGTHHPAAVKIGVWGWQFVQPQPVTLFFAATACFIGIFLQVLWHEHPITKPL